jgi:hypothetical protein
MIDPTPPSVQNTDIALTKRSDYVWNPSKHAQISSVWEYTRLAGTKQGPYTLLCRCNASITYVPWVSDQPLEIYVTKGDLTVNGVRVNEGDYACAPSNTDGQFSSDQGMEALLVAHGRVVKADSIFAALEAGRLSDDEAADMVKLPWMDHLRRNVSNEHLPLLLRVLRENHSARVSELCISIARGLPSDELAEVSAALLETTSDVSLRVTCVLYLASKGKLSLSGWDKELKIFGSDPLTLLAVLRSFYSAKDNRGLRDAIEARRASGKYQYNEPFYELVVRLIESNA